MLQVRKASQGYVVSSTKRREGGRKGRKKRRGRKEGRKEQRGGVAGGREGGGINCSDGLQLAAQESGK